MKRAKLAGLQRNARVVLTRKSYPGTNQRFRWRVDAGLDLPVLPHGDDLVWGASCAVNDTNDPEIIAGVVATDTERYTQIVRAWRTDRQHHTFRDVDTRGITCENAGYGADG